MVALGLSVPMLAGLAMGMAFVVLFSIFLLTTAQSKNDEGPVASPIPQTQEELFRNNLLPGHALAIHASYSPQTNTTSLTVANPTSSNSFEDCNVVQQIFSPFHENKENGSGDLQQPPLNVTLKAYQTIPPHFIDNFEAPIVPEELERNYAVNISGIASHAEYADRIAGRSWFMLECKAPSESVAFPYITIGGGTDAISYHAGDMVTVRGIVGFSEVTIRVPGLIEGTEIETGEGGSFVYSFMLPADAGKERRDWFVQVELPDSSMMQFGLKVE